MNLLSYDDTTITIINALKGDESNPKKLFFNATFKELSPKIGFIPQGCIALEGLALKDPEMEGAPLEVPVSATSFASHTMSVKKH